MLAIMFVFIITDNCYGIYENIQDNIVIVDQIAILWPLEIMLMI